MENFNDSNLFEPNLLKDRYLKEVKIFKLYSVYMIFYCINCILSFFMHKYITKMVIRLTELIDGNKISMFFLIAVFVILFSICSIGVYFFVFRPYLYFYKQKEIGSIIKIDKDRKIFNIVIKCQRWLIIYLLFSIITGSIGFAIAISPLFKITVFSYIGIFF